MTDVVRIDGSTPMFAAAWRRIRRLAVNGHQPTIAEIEQAIDDDPPTKKAFAAIAERVRAGEDVTVGEVARLTKLPVDFVAAVISSAVLGVVVEQRETVH